MKKHTPITLCFLILFLLSACTSSGSGTTGKPTAIPTRNLLPQVNTPVPPSSAYPVVIDTDMAGDDWMAILFLLHRSDVDLQAITVTGAGEAHCDPGVSNALGLVALAGQPPVAVACGRETPLLGSHVFPQSWRGFVDGLAGLSLPDGDNPVSGLDAVQLLSQVIQSSPQKVTLLALGPLTNVAEALLAEPALAENIRMIYIMGGAVTVPGNLGAEVEGNTTAEWNIYIDPHAANIVFGSGVPVTLVGLDATNNAPVTMDFYNRLEAARVTPSADFIYNFLSQMQDFIRSGGYYFWDPLSAGIMVNETLASFQEFHLCAIETEGPESGRTTTLDGCPSVRVALSADGSLFEQLFIDTLNTVPVP